MPIDEDKPPSEAGLPPLPDLPGLEKDPVPAAVPPPPAPVDAPPIPLPKPADPKIIRPKSLVIEPEMQDGSGSHAAPHAGADPDSFLGKTIGGYRLESRLGQGGMGLVFKGRQVSLDRQVAIKLLNKQLCENIEFIRRFEREAKSIAKINHPNIVAVYDFGQQDGLWYMVNEFVEGSSLARLIGEKMVVPIEDLLPLMVQCLAGLAHVELQNIVHRDIKPDNILITRDGVAKIADFGLAKDVSETKDTTDLTAVGLAMGTPAYMSPEQCMGRRLDGRSDQYALGVTAWFALTGEKPFTGNSSFEIMTKQREYMPPPPHHGNPSLPKEVSELVMRMLAKDPADRFENAESCRQAWLDFGTESGILAAKTRSGEHPALPGDRRSGRHKSPMPAAGVALPPVPMATPAPPPEPPPATIPAPPPPPHRTTGEHRVPPSPEPPPRPANLRRGAETIETAELRPVSERLHRPSGEAITCPRCGQLNRLEISTCTRCGHLLHQTDSFTAARDQQAQAQKLQEQGHHREAAAIWARLADQETDRRAKSILRAKERDARRAEQERQLAELQTRARSLVERGDLAKAVEVLEEGRGLLSDITASTAGTEAALAQEIAILKGRIKRGRATRLVLAAVLLLGAALAVVAWWLLHQGGGA